MFAIVNIYFIFVVHKQTMTMTMTNAITEIIAAELAANPFATKQQIIQTVETETGIDIGDIANSTLN